MNGILLGPIQPRHASGGWVLEGDKTGWWLTKRVGELHAEIRATTPTTCACTLYKGARVLREASFEDNVEQAKSQAFQWMCS